MALIGFGPPPWGRRSRGRNEAPLEQIERPLAGLVVLTDHEEFVNVLDCKKKLELLRKFKGQDEEHEALPILKEIQTAHQLWVGDQNALAHGFGAVGETGTLIVSSKPKPPVPADRFGQILTRANWLYLACSEVRRIASGLPLGSVGSLPNRPA
jgi:hypothetical protein